MSKPRISSLAAAIVGLSLIFVSPAKASPGDVATEFGSSVFDSDGEITVAAVQPDGKIIIAGTFTSLTDASGTHARLRVARLEADGSVDTGFGTSGSGPNGPVESVLLLPNGQILIGGDFTGVAFDSATVARRHVARLNADGSVDSAFGSDGNGPGPGGGGVLAMALQTDGKILVGGSFTQVVDLGGTYQRLRMARLNEDGSLDTAFNTAFNNFVRAIMIMPDERILVGGSFSDLNDGAPLNRTRIARINKDGSGDPGFGFDDKGASDSVYSIALQPDGKVIIGGAFLTVSDEADSPHDTRRIARLETNGAVDLAFNPDTRGPVDGSIYTVVLQADGKVLVGGDFGSFFDGEAVLDRRNLVRLDGDGSFDSDFGSDGFGPGGAVRVGVPLPDGKVLIAGNFDETSISLGSPGRKKIAVLDNDPAINALGASSPTNVLWSLGGSAPEPTRVVFETSTDGGSNYLFLGDADRVAVGWSLVGPSIPAGARLRARGFLQSGYNNGSAGIFEATTGPLFSNVSSANPRPPSVQIRGPKRITTSRGRLVLKGTASDPDGDLREVRFIDSRPSGKRWRPAKGSASWTAAAVLKRGRNNVQVRAFDSRRAGSPLARITIQRR